MSAIGTSWGRFPRTSQRVLSIQYRDQPIPQVEGYLLPYGNGRSYGDCCLNDGGTLLHTRKLDRFIAFDTDRGTLCCESGVLLSEILALCVPHGWFLPVSPGTQYVTLGGAIANDVHGKNHHKAGAFGCHVTRFELLRSDGRRLLCTPQQNTGWFAASIGGLGLTGLITWAEIQLKHIENPWLETETHRFSNLDEFFVLSETSDHDYEYTVAWVDCAAKGKSLGRGLFMRGNHAPAGTAPQKRFRRRQWAVPVSPPISLITPLTLKAFNWLYYHRQRQPVEHALTNYIPYFYPLDSISNWNKIYGPCGFLQYQCVVPPAMAPAAIAELMGRVAASCKGSFLAVLKQFGDRPSPGLMSFPRAGTTLALDFPNTGDSTLRLLNQLDEVVANAGGAVYPAKDARMAGEHFRQYFPNWSKFKEFIDTRFSSSFWRRVME
ncbi:MAG: FAD-binding oxidoreductase [Gammaproteobacteria bacterium]